MELGKKVDVTEFEPGRIAVEPGRRFDRSESGCVENLVLYALRVGFRVFGKMAGSRDDFAAGARDVLLSHEVIVGDEERHDKQQDFSDDIFNAFH